MKKETIMNLTTAATENIQEKPKKTRTTRKKALASNQLPAPVEMGQVADKILGVKDERILGYDHPENQIKFNPIGPTDPWVSARKRHEEAARRLDTAVLIYIGLAFSGGFATGIVMAMLSLIR